MDDWYDQFLDRRERQLRLLGALLLSIITIILFVVICIAVYAQYGLVPNKWWFIANCVTACPIMGWVLST